MSGAGSTLTAKLVLTGDSKGIVGAATDASAALAGLRTAANDTGTAGAGMAAKFGAAQLAIEGQTHATIAANTALAEGGEAKAAHIAYLTGLVKEGAPATASIQALSAAHAEYNATVGQARKLLDDGVIGQAAYATAVEGASQKLALQKIVADSSTKGLKDVTGGAASLAAAHKALSGAQNEATVSEENLVRMTATMGRGFGFGQYQVEAFRAALVSVPQVIAAYPLEFAFAGAIAALVGLVIAEQSYEASVRKVDVAQKAHLQTLALTRQGYADMAEQIATTANISTRSARTFEAQLLGGDVTPNTWNELAAAARGYAIATGTDIPTALAKLAESELKPSDALKELQKKFGIVDDATIQYAEHLERLGQKQDAQALLAGTLKDHFGTLAGEMSGLAKVFQNVETNMSNLFDKMGHYASEVPEWAVRLGAVTVAMALAGPGAAVDAWQATGAPSAAPPGVPKTSGPGAGSVADAATAAQRQLNDESVFIGDTFRQYKPYDTQLSSLNDDKTRLQRDVAKNDRNSAAAGQALAAVEHQIAVREKERTDAELKLNDALRAKLAHIKELIAASPEVVANVQREARATQLQDDAFSHAALARQYLNDQLAVEKATLPYVTARDGASAGQKKKLLDIIQAITKATQEQLTAQHELDAKGDITSRMSGLSGPNLPQSAFGDIFSIQLKQLNDWKVQSIADLDETKPGYAEFVKYVATIYNQDLAQLYRDDLARRTDWGSGVKRTLDQLAIDQADWAKTSASLTQSAAQTFHDSFVNDILSSKDPLQAWFDWFKKAMAEAIYQKYLASTFNGFAGDIVNGIGSIFGLSGGISGASVGTNIGSGAAFLAGVHHAGLESGSFAHPLATRIDIAANWDGAPRFHQGTPGLAANEKRVIVEDSETIRTAAQEAAVQRALSQPLVVQLPAHAAAAGAAPQVTIKLVNNSGTALNAKQGPTTRNGQGGFDVEVLIDLMDSGLAARDAAGRSQLTQSLDRTRNLKRTTF